MVKEKLNELLDSIYELEGLVHLALTRDDNPEHLPELIVRKGEELARRAADAVSVAHATTPDSKQEEPGAASPKQEEPLYMVEHEEEEISAEGFSPAGAGFSPAGADFSPTDAGFSPIEEDMQSVVESVFNALPEDVNFAENPVEGNLAENPVEGNFAENPVEGNLADEPEEADEANEFDPASREPRGKLVFSINDRYRFKRELFNNSDADFNNTLALVASMDGYDEAEDYFLGELQWDSKRGEVVDFLDILKRYFKE